MKPSTLRGRLALVALFTSVAWVLLLLVVFNVLLGDRLRADADNLLRTRAEAAAATVRVLPDGRLSMAEPADDQALDTDIWIYLGARSAERPVAPRLLQDRADALALSGRGFAQIGEVRLYARPIEVAQRKVGTVVTAVGLRPYRRTISSALVGSVAMAVLLLAGVYTVTRSVVGRALRPVAEMSRQAADWSGNDLGRRFGTGRRPAELASLAARLDELLDRLSVVLRHERQWSAELSHELRTPLSRILAEADWLRDRPRAPADQKAALESINGAAEEMRRICDTLLAEARTRSTELPGRCLLDPLTRDLAARWPGDAPRLRVEPIDDALIAGAPPEIVERILAPLLSNARRHAITSVTLRCEQGIHLTICDDGPGVPPQARDHIFDPGFRADPDDGHDGAGLGLPLARRLARAAGGDVTFTAPSVFTVNLPPG